MRRDERRTDTKKKVLIDLSKNKEYLYDVTQESVDDTVLIADDVKVEDKDTP